MSPLSHCPDCGQPAWGGVHPLDRCPTPDEVEAALAEERPPPPGKDVDE